MKPQRARVVTVAKAPRSTVWALLAVGSAWNDWGPFERVELLRRGSDDEWGRGAIRQITSGRTVTVERIETFAVGHRVRYRLVSGLPLRQYHGEVVLRDLLEGTEIEWSSTFYPPHRAFAALSRLRIGRSLEDLADRLARAAEARILELVSAA